MKREVIKRYKKEFEHWLENGSCSIMHRDLYSKWHSMIHLDWEDDAEEVSYVINDEYIDLRIAEAEGKTIQLCIMNEWSDTSRQCFDFERYPLNMWRVKPETVIKWQWTYYSKQLGRYTITSFHYSENEAKIVNMNKPYKFEPSAREFEV